MGRAELAELVESGLVERVRPTTLATDQRLPVLPALEPLVPGGGLRRGSTLSIDGPAATSLALATAAAASQAGAWVAAVGFPSLGLVAAAELGVALGRLVLVASPDTDPGPDNETAAWAAAVAALVDAFEIVLVRSGMGRAMMPYLAIDPDDPGIVVLGIDPPMARRIQLTRCARRSLPPAADRFTELAVEVGAAALQPEAALAS